MSKVLQKVKSTNDDKYCILTVTEVVNLFFQQLGPSQHALEKDISKKLIHILESLVNGQMPLDPRNPGGGPGGPGGSSDSNLGDSDSSPTGNPNSGPQSPRKRPRTNNQHGGPKSGSRKHTTGDDQTSPSVTKRGSDNCSSTPVVRQTFSACPPSVPRYFSPGPSARGLAVGFAYGTTFFLYTYV